MINKHKFYLMLLLTPFIISACGVVSFHEKTGQNFLYTESIKVKQGMTESDVVTLLGKPYVVGYEENGDILYRYEWSETHGRAFGFGFFIMGERRTIGVTGGSAEIRFAQDTKTVKKIEYKIIGSDDYNKLKRGTDATSH